MQNPYVTEDYNSRLLNSIIVLMDILGYKDLIMESKERGLEKETLDGFRKLIYAPYKNLSFSKDGLFEKNRGEIKFYSDNVLLGYPIEGDGEIEFGSAVDSIAMFQFSMALSGIFIRGALAAGNLFIDDHIVFGSGLIDAYNAEILIANNPRIVITNSAVHYLKKHLEYYGDGRMSPQYLDLMRDSDNRIFINYLNVLFVAGLDDPYTEELKMHKEIVKEKLDTYSNNLKIFNKYTWVACYHNYFCNQHSYYFGEEYNIKLKSYDYTFSNII